MEATATRDTASQSKKTTSQAKIEVVQDHIVEIVSDSGEGAQTAGQMFGMLCARSGNGVWTVEIIPAEIEPPPRSRAGASGNRIRFASNTVTNMGDAADVVVAFNEQVPYSRIDVLAFKPGTRIFLECRWATDPDPEVVKAYNEAMEDFEKRGYVVHELPMEEECRKVVADPRRGKNMWVTGFLCALYNRDLEKLHQEVARKFSRKGEKVLKANLNLVDAGHAWCEANVPLRYDMPANPDNEKRVVMNGNQAIGMGAMGAGMELCSMYPITPATSVSHYLADVFHAVGGFVHQAEDEIAAVGFAIGASYAGKTALTVTSGPGMALKTEFMALAVMAEVPLVMVVVQRGGPSTGLPTRVEQGDLLATLFGQPGDSPKIVLAPATIGECYHIMITARKLAEAFRTLVVVLTDANLATGVQPFLRPKPEEEWLAPPIDQSAWTQDVKPFAWDKRTGLSKRPIPGQRGGEYVLTGLAHDQASHVAYESAINQEGMVARSRKIASLGQTLKPPTVHGAPEGDLLVVGWGSTLGAIEEAVDRARKEGQKVSSLHLRFLSPMEPGLKEIFGRFRKVMTVEVNYSDDVDQDVFTQESRRYAQLAWLLRAQTLVDVDCWSRVPGVPLQPWVIEEQIRKQLKALQTL